MAGQQDVKDPALFDQLSAREKMRQNIQKAHAQTQQALADAAAANREQFIKAQAKLNDRTIKAKEAEAKAKAQAEGKPAPPPAPAVGQLRAGQTDALAQGSSNGGIPDISALADGVSTIGQGAPQVAQEDVGLEEGQLGSVTSGLSSDSSGLGTQTVSRTQRQNFPQSRLATNVLSLIDFIGGTQTAFSEVESIQKTLPTRFQVEMANNARRKDELTIKRFEFELNEARADQSQQIFESLDPNLPRNLRLQRAEEAMKLQAEGKTEESTLLLAETGLKSDAIYKLQARQMSASAQLAEQQANAARLDTTLKWNEYLQKTGLQSIGINADQSQQDLGETIDRIGKLTGSKPGTGGQFVDENARLQIPGLVDSYYAGTATNILDGHILVYRPPEAGAKAWLKQFMPGTSENNWYGIPVQTGVDMLREIRVAQAANNPAAVKTAQEKLETLFPGLKTVEGSNGMAVFDLTNVERDPELSHLSRSYRILANVANTTFQQARQTQVQPSQAGYGAGAVEKVTAIHRGQPTAAPPAAQKLGPPPSRFAKPARTGPTTLGDRVGTTLRQSFTRPTPKTNQEAFDNLLNDLSTLGGRD